MVDIFRPQTESEKNLKTGGFKDIRYWRQSDIKHRATKNMTEIAQECIYKKRMPYCFKCANDAVNEKVDEVEKEIKKAILAKKETLDLSLDINYNSFGGFENFEYVGDKEIIETIRVAGIRETTITGKYKNYVCKKCHNTIRIQFDNRELDNITDNKKREKLGEMPLEDAKKSGKS